MKILLTITAEVEITPTIRRLMAPDEERYLDAAASVAANRVRQWFEGPAEVKATVTHRGVTKNGRES